MRRTQARVAAVTMLSAVALALPTVAVLPTTSAAAATSAVVTCESHYTAAETWFAKASAAYAVYQRTHSATYLRAYRTYEAKGQAELAIYVACSS